MIRIVKLSSRLELLPKRWSRFRTSSIHTKTLTRHQPSIWAISATSFTKTNGSSCPRCWGTSFPLISIHDLQLNLYLMRAWPLLLTFSKWSPNIIQDPLRPEQGWLEGGWWAHNELSIKRTTAEQEGVIWRALEQTESLKEAKVFNLMVMWEEEPSEAAEWSCLKQQSNGKWTPNSKYSVGNSLTLGAKDEEIWRFSDLELQRLRYLET